MRIVFAGNPNSGKTTMYNALTGGRERVGNWAGVTVEKKEGRIRKGLYEGPEGLAAVDLPGAYSLSPFTSEESITSAYIRNEKPDAIINIVDATNLSRSLFFTTQLLELGIPMVVALNKSDVNARKRTRIDVDALSKRLGCPVIETISASGAEQGLREVVRAAAAAVGAVPGAPYRQRKINPQDKGEVLAADRRRFEFVKQLVAEVETRRAPARDRNYQDRMDAVLTDSRFGIPVFAAVMFLVFQISQVWVGPLAADMLAALLETLQEGVRGFFADANPFLSALLVDGVIGGAAAVIGFLPFVMVMYFLIALLEDCGYMARATVVLDPIFKRVGLSGKSVIPFVITIGCAVPGVMATRIIRNERERRAAAMLAPFMPCGAKVPVISLFAGAFFDEHQGMISTGMYLTGIALIFFGAFLVNKIAGRRAGKSFFIMELPEYKFPNLSGALASMCDRGRAYVVRASTIILVCNTVVQIMQTFDRSFAVAESADSSILAFAARPFAYFLVPVVGVLSWQLAAAALTGFIAKENVVGTLAVCFAGLENFIDTEELALLEGAGTEAASVFAVTRAAALAYLMFNLYSPPCFAAIGAMCAEMGSAGWLWGGIGLQFGIGFTVSCLVFQIGTLVTTGGFGRGVVPGMLLIAGFAAVILCCIARNNRNAVREQ